MPPMSPELKADLDRLVGYVTGDGNPLDAWGNGTFVPNLDHALAALQGSPDHDAIVFCRDNCSDQPMDQPETAINYLEAVRPRRRGERTSRITSAHPRRADRSGACRNACARAGIPIVAGIREGSARSTNWRAGPTGSATQSEGNRTGRK